MNKEHLEELKHLLEEFVSTPFNIKHWIVVKKFSFGLHFERRIEPSLWLQGLPRDIYTFCAVLEKRIRDGLRKDGMGSLGIYQLIESGYPEDFDQEEPEINRLIRAINKKERA